MRSTDNPWPEYQKPLGEKVEKRPPPKPPQWKPLESNPNVYERPDGKLSTAIPLPKFHFWGKF